ncbi:MAG: hypothetical protein FWB80_13225, partial [Defluviitaleaceae bacterium]|nr:hypothetical protein [Defluviitaleaceae bacterium]
MKKKVALLLALVMVLAMLPMNVFGAVRAGTVLNPRVSPQWGLQSFTFRIDGAAFSSLDRNVIRFAMLDFQLSGGANSNAVGFASSAALAVTFAAGPGFRVNGDPAGSAAANAFLASLNAASTYASGNREFLDYARTPAYENWLDVQAGRTRRNLNVLGQADTGVWGGLLNAPYDVEAGTVTDIPADGVRRSARRLMIDLLGGDDNRLAPTVEGFIDVQVTQIRPDSDAANMAIYLRTGGENIMHTPIQLLNAPLVGDWGNGVTISAVSVVPMQGIAQLSGVRITEAIPGRLMPATGGGGHFYVRLVAPAGFVWDTGRLEGLVPSDLRVEINDAVGVMGNQEPEDRVRVVSLPGNAANPHLNPSTDRSELYLRIDHGGRGESFVNRTTNAQFTIRGLTLIPVRGAARTGNVAIDAFVGNTGSVAPPAGTTFTANQGRQTDTIVGNTWGHGHFLPWQVTSTTASAIPTFTDHMGSFWSEHNSGGSNWRALDLVVASLDTEGDIEVIGPASPANVISGRLSNGELSASGTGFAGGQALAFSNISIAGNPRWMHGGNHTIRLQEVVPGTLFRNLDTFELRPVQEGVRIVDASVQAGRDGAADTNFAWRGFDNNESFISALTDFTGDYLVFAPRTIDAEEQSRLRRMDIRLLLSIEAGFEARHGEAVEIEVFRNGISMGVAHVADASDLITLDSGPLTTITRNAFDVLGLTPVSSFSISETEIGNLRSGDTFTLGLRAVQNGREVQLGAMGTMTLHLGAVEFNEAESGMVIEAVRGQNNTFRVVRGSTGVPGVINFSEVNLSGPTVPGIEWHVFAFGPQISPNSEFVIMPIDTLLFDQPAAPAGQEASPVGYRSVWEQRAIFYGLPFSTKVLDVQGQAVIEGPGPGAPGQGAGTVTTSFTLATLDREGHSALHFEQIGGFNVSMFGARM